MERFSAFFRNLAVIIRRMSPSQVMMLFGVVAGTIAGVILLSGWVNSIRYAQLYSDLAQNDAGEIVSYLDENKIPYKLTRNGTAIEIPSDRVYKTRISLASRGIPQGGTVGYSIFDKNNLGMTDFLQNLNFRRALEGELTRTIMQLNEVQAARVHIVMPKERLFKKDKLEATASVVLKLAGRDGLTQHQINGIAHLVASSVEGLKPANIAILDYDGNLLSSGQDNDELAALSGSQLEVRKNVERYLQDKAQSMLDGVLGPGRSVVRVTADLDFQQLEKTSETYDPNSPSVRSEEQTKTNNTTSDKPSETAESNQQGSEEYTVTNYELNKTVEHIISAVGGITRLSVAILVDGVYEQVTNDNGDVEQVYKPRPQDEMDRLTAIVRNAVGFDQTRNDQIEIVNLPFDRRDLEGDRQWLDSVYQRDFYLDLAKRVGLVLLALFGLFYLRKKSRKLFGALKALIPPPPPPQPVVTAAPAATPVPAEEEVKPIEPEKRKARLTDQMQLTAKERPEEVAKVIKTMMIE